MPEIIFSGTEGRLEGRYHHSRRSAAPVALILHPHPLQGGTMNNRVVFSLFHAFQRHGFSVMRFNFRGVGRSQGRFDSGPGELSDAAAALDWLQGVNPNASACWIAGYSFGAWIGMQLMMRRPEIAGFISVAPPAGNLDFSFLAPCPASGLVVHGENDDIVPIDIVERLAKRLGNQKNIVITFCAIPGTDHFFTNSLPRLSQVLDEYLKKAIDKRA
jgi:alpha/beta superfamily hydrolase